MNDKPEEIPIIHAPATVIPPATTEAEKDAASQRLIHEQSAAKTTEEEDRHSAGQRQINVVWENTQKLIALSVTWVSLMIASWLAVMGATESVQTAALVFVFGVANLVIGFYFGRTNHQRVGGVNLGR